MSRHGKPRFHIAETEEGYLAAWLGERGIGWRDDAMDFRIEVDSDEMARITRLSTPPAVGAPCGDAALPLLDVILAGEGKAWSGGTTPGGRFCNVFRFRGDRVASLHIYLDPDYTSDDEPRFRWGKQRRW